MKPESTGSAEPQLGNNDTSRIADASAHYRVDRQLLDVPPGYKRTEVGVIPEDWEVRRLGELGRVVRGGSPRPAGDPKFFNGSFIPWLTVAALTNLPENCLYVSETVTHLTEEGAKRSRTLAPSTLIIANSGATLGIAKILGLKCCANDGIAAIIEQRAGNRAFLCHYINTQTLRLRDVVATGNGQPNLNTALIRGITIPFPSAPEQRAIAEALSDVDGLLGALEALIAKKRAIKRAAMQQLLTGNTRLPGFSGPWETKRLGEIGRFRSGSGFPTKFQGATAGKYPFFKVSDMNNDGNEIFMEVSNNYIDEEVRKQLGAVPFPAGSVVFAKVGAAVFLERKKLLIKASCLDNNMAAFVRDDSTANFRFIHYVFLNTALGDLVSTTAMPSLNGNVLSAIDCLLPPIDEQTAIATVLSDIDAEIAALERRRDKTRAIKQGMMQQLLTGRVRLVKHEGNVEHD
ncbi:MAG: restriction endonuclease subunit S [Porticoccaceae bacterium]